MNELAARKQALIVEAELHRQVIAAEALQLQARSAAAAGLVRRYKWWLVGGAAALGVLVARKPGVLTKWLPSLLAAWR